MANTAQVAGGMRLNTDRSLEGYWKSFGPACKILFQVVIAALAFWFLAYLLFWSHNPGNAEAAAGRYYQPSEILDFATRVAWVVGIIFAGYVLATGIAYSFLTGEYYQKNKVRVAPWLFLAPAMFFFIVYVILPIFQSLWISFYEWDGLGEATWVGLGNYVELMDDDRFYTSLYNNVLWLVLYMLAVPAGLFIALFLNQTVTGMRIYKSLFFFPFVISQVVVGLIFTWFYNPNFGIVGEIWRFFGAAPPSILGDENLVTYGIIFAGLWPQIAYCMILYLTGLNNVSPDQVEAGRLDNAKGWKMLWYVILPQLKPATFIAVVVTVIGALRSFDMIAIMTQGGPYGSSNVLSYYMFETALSEYGFRMGYGSAIAAVLFFIMLFFISYFLWSMYQEEKEGR